MELQANIGLKKKKKKNPPMIQYRIVEVLFRYLP